MENKKKIPVIILGIILLIPALLLSKEKKNQTPEPVGFQNQPNYKALNTAYKQWIDLVSYIAGNEEIKAFLELPTTRDRDLYINLFWKLRDPTPGTTENEYKKEIQRRFEYVNTFYGRGTPRPGWKTDMGRIYMILGQPNSIETFDNQPGLFPAQVWYYYGDQSLDLPSYFNVTFFKKNGIGEWILYDPAADGPGSLIISEDTLDTHDNQALYKKIQSLAPTLASPSISMIPNEKPYGYQPSTQNTLIISNIYKSPTKKINVYYASNFKKYKGFVHLDSSINFIENSHLVNLTRVPGYNADFLQFSIKPKQISVDFSKEKNQYYFNFNIIVSLKKGDTPFYEYSKNFDYYFDKEKLDVIRSGGIVIQAAFPVIPGEYRLHVFLQNQLDNGFSYFEHNVKIPTGTKKPGPYLAPLLLGYKAEKQGDNFFYPYKFNEMKLSIDTEMMFASAEIPLLLAGVYNLDKPTWEKGYVEWELKCLREKDPLVKKGTIRLADQPFQTDIHFLQRLLPVQDADTSLPPGYYEITLDLYNAKGTLIDSNRKDIAISPLRELSRPTEMYSKLPADHPHYFDYILGVQYLNTGDPVHAETYLEKSVGAGPNNIEGIMA